MYRQKFSFCRIFFLKPFAARLKEQFFVRSFRSTRKIKAARKKACPLVPCRPGFDRLERIAAPAWGGQRQTGTPGARAPRGSTKPALRGDTSQACRPIFSFHHYAEKSDGAR